MRERGLMTRPAMEGGDGRECGLQVNATTGPAVCVSLCQHDSYSRPVADQLTPAALDFDVLIAGGGFAGIYCARALARRLGTTAKNRVVIVAEQNFMVFQPMLAEVAGSALAPRHVVN